MLSLSKHVPAVDPHAYWHHTSDMPNYVGLCGAATACVSELQEGAGAPGNSFHAAPVLALLPWYISHQMRLPMYLVDYVMHEYTPCPHPTHVLGSENADAVVLHGCRRMASHRTCWRATLAPLQTGLKVARSIIDCELRSQQPTNHCNDASWMLSQGLGIRKTARPVRLPSPCCTHSLACYIVSRLAAILLPTNFPEKYIRLPRLHSDITLQCKSPAWVSSQPQLPAMTTMLRSAYPQPLTRQPFHARALQPGILDSSAELREVEALASMHSKGPPGARAAVQGIPVTPVAHRLSTHMLHETRLLTSGGGRPSLACAKHPKCAVELRYSDPM